MRKLKCGSVITQLSARTSSQTDLVAYQTLNAHIEIVERLVRKPPSRTLLQTAASCTHGLGTAVSRADHERQVQERRSFTAPRTNSHSAGQIGLLPAQPVQVQGTGNGFCACGNRNIAPQQISPNRPSKVALRCKFQTGLFAAVGSCNRGAGQSSQVPSASRWDGTPKTALDIPRDADAIGWPATLMNQSYQTRKSLICTGPFPHSD